MFRYQPWWLTVSYLSASASTAPAVQGSSGIRRNPSGQANGMALPHRAPAVPKVVDEDGVPQVVRGAVVGPAAVDLGQLVDESDQCWIVGQHERRDDDLVPAAVRRLLERHRNDLRIHAEGVLVNA